MVRVDVPKRICIFFFFFLDLFTIPSPFTANEPDELCASMYSFHSSPEEKNKLLYALTQHGIETTVDRIEKKKRIRDWIQESVIQEDDEEDEDSEVMTQTARAPVAGHVSSVRAEEKATRKQIVTTVKDAANKHINPRTGKVQNGPSEMGHHNDNEPFEMNTNGMRTDNNHVSRRSTKLVDVGSQTSSESQKQLDAVTNKMTPVSSLDNVHMSKQTQTIPLLAQQTANGGTRVQNTQTNITRTESISRGLLSSYDPLVVTVPEAQTQAIQQNLHQRSQRDWSQPRQSYNQHRHNTTALTKQPISRSVYNFNNNLVNDSGYGSLDKLRPIDGNPNFSSPILPKRMMAQPALPQNGANENNVRIHLNGLSHSQNESNSPFHSDSGGDGSPCGSNGFVNYSGMQTEPMAKHMTISMKDTAYDRVRHKK